jgi:urease accessory protein
MTNRRKYFQIFLGIAATFAAPVAFAHHPMGGETPSSVVQGLLSGLAHPVIGIDHLAFLIAMGVAATFTSRPLLAPLAFIASTIAGCLLLTGGIHIPLGEIAVAASVILIGAIVASGRTYSVTSYLTLFAVAGLLHGSAYGAAIVGAETTPLIAYLTGFAAIQYAVAIGAGVMIRRISADPNAFATNPRLVGALAAGVGVAILIENIEGMITI